MAQESRYFTKPDAPLPRGAGGVVIGLPICKQAMERMSKNASDPNYVAFPRMTSMDQLDSMVVGNIVCGVRDPTKHDTKSFYTQNNQISILSALAGLRFSHEQMNFLSGASQAFVPRFKVWFARSMVRKVGIAAHKYTPGADSIDQGLLIQLSGVASVFKGYGDARKNVMFTPGERLYADVPVENRGELTEKLADYNGSGGNSVAPSGQSCHSYNLEPVSEKEFYASSFLDLRERVKLMIGHTHRNNMVMVQLLASLFRNNRHLAADFDPAAMFIHAITTIVVTAMESARARTLFNKINSAAGGVNVYDAFGLTQNSRVSTTTLDEISEILEISLGVNNPDPVANSSFDKLISAFRAFQDKMDSAYVGRVISDPGNGRVHVALK